MRLRSGLVLLAASLLTVPAAGADHAQTSGGHTVTFDHKTGNEWWVEAIVTASGLAGVEARDTDGAWVALTLRSWGAWAASFHVEPGHPVQLRARFTDGAVVESCWFTHPAGVEQCGTQGFSATFSPKPGNEWWVEVKVAANEPLAGVDARVVDGAWNALTLRSWGAWAKSFHVPDGSVVEFRARSADGDVAASGRYRWPDATPVTGPAWPVEGSFVKYEAATGESVPGYADWTEVNVTLSYAAGAWTRRCEGWHYRDVDDNFTSERIESTAAVAGPPRGPTSARPGEWADVPGPGCVGGGASGAVFGPIATKATRNGTPVDVTAWYVSYEPVWPQDSSAAWDQVTGLVLGWDDARSHSGDRGRLVDTDAPLAKAPPRTSWPFEGSFARYRIVELEDDWQTYANVTYTFRDGGWTATCSWHTRSVRDGDRFDNYTYVEAPAYMPTGIAAGARMNAPYVDFCGWKTMEDVVAKGQFPEDTTRNGQPYRARVWWADEDPDAEAYGIDRDVWWDAKLGLVLRWENERFRGKLANTDAPLTAY